MCHICGGPMDAVMVTERFGTRYLVVQCRKYKTVHYWPI